MIRPTMHAVVLYSYWRSSCSWRVRSGLALKEIPYRYVAVNLLESEQTQPGYAERNALRQVPCLEWKDATGADHRLTQSLAILQWLDAQPGTRLIPEDPLSAARAWQLAEIINAGIQPLQNLKVLASITELGADRKAWGQDVIRDGFRAMEPIAAQTAGRFLVGDAPSIADLCLLPQLYNARRFELSLDEFPTLLRVEAACADLPALHAAHPDRQPDAVKE